MMRVVSRWKRWRKCHWVSHVVRDIYCCDRDIYSADCPLVRFTCECLCFVSLQTLYLLILSIRNPVATSTAYIVAIIDAETTKK